MWKPFDKKSHSVICAFNISPFLESALVSNIMADKPCTYQIARMQGVFKGLVENSFQIDKRALDWTKFLAMMHRFEQDMVLLVKENGYVYPLLRESNYYHDNLSESCGKFKEVTEQGAKQNGDYMYCYTSNKYYVLELDDDRLSSIANNQVQGTVR